MLKNNCIIVDIDETIAYGFLNEDLPSGFENERKNWDKYHKKRQYYSTKVIKPIREVIELIERYYNSFYIKPKVIFLTGRENVDKIRLNTYRFIRKHFQCFNMPQDYNRKYYLFMRKENDYRPNHEIKEEYLKDSILPYYNVILAFDDDKNNKDMFLKNGITVIQPHSVDVHNLIKNS